MNKNTSRSFKRINWIKSIIIKIDTSKDENYSGKKKKKLDKRFLLKG